VLHTSHPAPDEPRSPVELTAVPDLEPVAVTAVPPGTPDLLDGLLDDGEDTLSLVFDGAVDFRLEAELAEVLGSIRSSPVRHIVLEMATVTSMDSAGLRFLFHLQSLAEERAGTVRLADPTDAVRELIQSSGATAILGLLDELAPRAAVAEEAGTSTEGWAGARPA
jgi:anti-anti-sigma factor